MKLVAQNSFGLILLIGALMLSYFTYKDYGLSSDEHLQHKLGEYSYKYVFENDPTYTWYGDNDYGVATELPLYFIVDVVLGKTSLPEIFKTRHIILHNLFLLAVFVFYSLAKRLLKSNWLAILGALMLLLHPRIYAHSFFNSKDLPLLSFTIFGLYILFRYIENRKTIWLILLAIISALIINNRIIGLMFFATSIAMFFIEFGFKTDKSKTVKSTVVYGVITALMLYVTWPILWKQPFYRLGVVFKNMAHFRWEENVLFNGEIIKATELPWNYLPYWFFVTTPIIILTMGVIGLGFVIYKSAKKIKSLVNDNQLYFTVLNVILFVMPIIAIIVLKSVVYDGWRHVYFIYPSFILIAIFSIQKLFKENVNKATILVVALLMLETLPFMLKNHPNQQVYFNAFINKDEDLKNRMEFEYWGLSYRGALEYILQNDDRDSIVIAYETAVCKKNTDVLLEQQKQRLIFTKDIDSANYFITNYRWHMVKDSSYSETLKTQPFYDLKYKETSIMTTWKLDE